MDKSTLALGGTILLAGGLAYWYLSQQKPDGNGTKECVQNKTETDCTAQGCYWYDNSCHNMPKEAESCQYLGNCYPNIMGWQLCDYYNNLCRCDGTNWNLVQKDSYICRDDIKYNKCGVNDENNVFCSEYMGYGYKECEYYAAGCDCSIGECQTSCWCNPKDKICIKKAIGNTIIGNDNYWNCWEEHLPGNGGNSCLLELEQPIAASQFAGGTFSWKWGFIGGTGILAIYLGYKGEYVKIWSQTGIMWGSEGYVTIQPFNFIEIIVFDSIVFHTEANYGINIKPKAFTGKFLF